ncbi:MAG: hypothetical protein ACYTGC_14530, partial [Planctomycetota bacterium]
MNTRAHVAARSIALAVVTLVASTVVAEAPFGTRVPVPGLGGAVIIGGPGGVFDDLTASFVELAGGDDATLALLVVGTVPEHLARWPAQMNVPRTESTAVLRITTRDGAGDPGVTRAVAGATGVWLVTASPDELTTLLRGSAVARELQTLVRRGGVVGASARASEALGERMLVGAAEAIDATPALRLLPGFVVDRRFASVDHAGGLMDDVGRERGLVGLGVERRTALVVRGRRGRVLGTGRVVTAVAADARRDTRTDTFRSDQPMDVIALSRAAVARAGEPFVPGVPELEGGTLFIGGGGRMPAS